MRTRLLIWDFNGTLLDDVDPCVATLNSLLTERGLPALSRSQYRARFGFPVRAFYEGLGFDFQAEDFGALAHDFIARYRSRSLEVGPTAGVKTLLQRLGARGLSQVVVSAMETQLLGTMLHEQGLLPHFQAFHGRADHGAGSKIEIGVDAVAPHGLDPAQIMIVGDTLHDLELAQAIGCRCVLFTGGHQDRGQLESGAHASGTAIVDTLDDVQACVDVES